MSGISKDIKKAIKETPNIIEERNKVINKRANAPYDGVMGTPPEWVPEDIRRKFESIRNGSLDDLLCKLESTSKPKDSLEEIARQQLLTWVREKLYTPSFEDGSFLRNPFYDAGDDSKDELIASRIDFLAQLWDGVLIGRSKGVSEGLKIIFGEETGRHVQQGEEQEFNLRTKGTPVATEKRITDKQERLQKYKIIARPILSSNMKLSATYVAKEVCKRFNIENKNEKCTPRMVKDGLANYKKVIAAEIKAQKKAEKDLAWGFIRKES